MKSELFVLTAVMICQTALAQDILRLKATAIVTTGDVRVCDIADVETDGLMKESLERTVLVPAPLAGQRRTLTPDDVLMRLRLQNIDVTQMSVAGAPETIVTRKSRLICGEDMVDAVRKKIDEMRGSDADLIVEITRAPVDLVVPDAPYALSVEMPELPRENATLTATVSITQGGALLDRVSVVVGVRVFGLVAVTVRDMAKGELFTEKDVFLKKEEMVQAIKGAYGELVDLAGKSATQTIAKNRVVVPRMVETPLSVKRGSRVTMIYEVDNLKITATVVAKQDGRVGDVISVVNMSTKKDLSARVESPGLVRFMY